MFLSTKNLKPLAEFIFALIGALIEKIVNFFKMLQFEINTIIATHPNWTVFAILATICLLGLFSWFRKQQRKQQELKQQELKQQRKQQELKQQELELERIRLGCEQLERERLEREQLRREQLEREQLERELERERLIKLYGETIGTFVFEKKIQIGFNKEMVVYVLGNPEHETEKITGNKINERWWYGQYRGSRGAVKFTKYVDFVDGKVTGWGDN